MTSPVRVLAAGVLLATLGLATGCGGTDADSATDSATDAATSGAASVPASTTTTTPPTTPPTSPSSPTGTPAVRVPDCAEVWVAGELLPRGYSACLDGAERVEADKHGCSFGTSIVEYADRFYAVPGKSINEVPDLEHSATFRAALSACQA